MYHIPNDKRAKKSAERIGNGLLACLQKKSFTETTVTNVQETATVGRATFYRLFDNTADVLAYLCDSVFENTGKEFAEMKIKNPKDTTLKFIQKWMDNRLLLQAIVDSNRLDFLYDAHAKYLGENLNYFFPNATIGNTQKMYLMTTMTACTSAFLAAWLKNGAQESAEQLQRLLKDCFETLGYVFK